MYFHIILKSVLLISLSMCLASLWERYSSEDSKYLLKEDLHFDLTPLQNLELPISEKKSVRVELNSSRPFHLKAWPKDGYPQEWKCSQEHLLQGKYTWLEIQNLRDETDSIRIVYLVSGKAYSGWIPKEILFGTGYILAVLSLFSVILFEKKSEVTQIVLTSLLMMILIYQPKFDDQMTLGIIHKLLA